MSSSSAAASSAVPLLRPPIPGHHNRNGSKPPKLTLGIPPSPNSRPLVNGNPVNPVSNAPAAPPPLQMPAPRPTGRPAPPQLRLATPMGSNGELPAEMPRMVNGRPAPPPLATTGLNEGAAHAGGAGGGAGGNYSYLDGGKASGPTSASSSDYSTLSFAMGLRQPAGSTPDPSSAISSVYSEREGGVPERDNSSVNGLIPDLDKLSLEKGRSLDVDDLDDEGWLAASEQKKIVELGSLGEGAGGAVTRCKLKDGKTVFALKVGSFLFLFLSRESGMATNDCKDYHDRSESRRQKADYSRTQFQQALRVRPYLSVLWGVHGQVDGNHLDFHGVLRGRKFGQYLQGSAQTGGAYG